MKVTQRHKLKHPMHIIEGDAITLTDRAGRLISFEMVKDTYVADVILWGHPEKSDGLGVSSKSIMIVMGESV